MAREVTSRRSNPDLDADVQQVLAWKYRVRAKVDPEDGQLDPQAIYRQLMNAWFAPALRREGLQGSSGRFEYPSEDYWALLGFQKSPHSDRSEVRFTVNLSVIGRAEWAEAQASGEAWGFRPTPSSFYIDLGHQTRIGTLGPEQRDKWWILRRGEDPSWVRDDVLTDLDAIAVPWLKRMTSTGAAG